MLRELNQWACSAPKPRPWKFMTFEKVLPCKQGHSEGQIFTRNFSTGPKFLVPAVVPAVETGFMVNGDLLFL